MSVSAGGSKITGGTATSLASVLGRDYKPIIIRMSKLKITFIVIAILIVPVIIFAWSGGIQYITAPFRGMLEKREQIQASGDFRIYSYNHFFDLCKSVQNAQSEYDSQKEVLDSMDEDEPGYDRQRRTVAILKADIEQRKQKYNSDARKEETVAAFKSNNLPEHMPLGEHEQGERVNCQ